jgi:Tfp pilus assembly protein PilN
MLSINLLAEESKQKINNQRLFFLFLKAEIILFLLVAMVGISFFWAEKTIVSNRSKFGQETSNVLRESGADYNLKVKNINARLAAITLIQSEFAHYSLYLKNVSALIPSGINLSRLQINTDGKTIKIVGLALRQEDLLMLEKNLKTAAFLTKVSNIPMKDIIKKNNIEFDFDLELDPSRLPSS